MGAEILKSNKVHPSIIKMLHTAPGVDKAILKQIGAFL